MVSKVHFYCVYCCIKSNKTPICTLFMERVNLFFHSFCMFDVTSQNCMFPKLFTYYSTFYLHLSKIFNVSVMLSVCVCVVSLACIAALCSAVAGWLSRWGMTICKWAVSLITIKRLMQLIFHYVPSPRILIISNCACEEQKSGICNSVFRQLQWELLKGFIICSLNNLFSFHLGSAMKPCVLIKSY